ncbi:MAG: TonB-dependent receptor [Rikenellaceae bacterium]|nr:TonB-dependent receptor [Rikenellaceae bacterium]
MPENCAYRYHSRNWENDPYTPLPWVYQDNWYKGFFQTGATTKNIITVNGNNGEGSSMRLSVTDMRSRWVIPNTPSSSQTFSVNATHKVNSAITLRAVVNYLRRDSDNVPYSGYGSKNPLYSLIWATSNHDINQGFKAEYFSGRFDDPAVRAANALFYNAENSYNPYFTVYEEVNTVDRDRVYGNFSLTIDITPRLRLLLRSGLDMNNEFRTQRAPKYSGSTPGGFYREQTLRSYEWNNEFLITYNQSLLDDLFSLGAGFGGVNWRKENANTRLNVPQLNEDYVFNLSNVHEDYMLEATDRRTAKEKNSFLGYLNLAWKNYLYLDITGRNDWSSTLDPEYWSYFYPSVGLSVVVSDAFSLYRTIPWIDLIKFRASWAQVGNDTDPYAIMETALDTDYSGGFRVPTTLATRDLSPEQIKSVEVGVDLSLFQKRITFDASYYHTVTDKQIISILVDALTGATTMRRNAGEMLNHGVELAVSFVPVQRPAGGLRWSFSMNWSKNWNRLKSMYEGWDNNSPLQTAMGTTIGNRVYVYSYVGESMHYIYGKDYVRAPEGSTYTDEQGRTVDCSGMKIINSNTGMPALTENPDQRIAKVNPDWYAGMTHNLSYKNWSLGMHLAAQYGGHTFSANHFALAYQGKLKNSLPGRYDGLVVDGVNQLTDGSGHATYQKNNTVTENIQTYYNAYVYIRDNVRENTFSTSYLKLKNVRLDYTFPAHLLQKTGFLQGASLGVYATNVFCITKYPMFDPETGNLQGTNIHRGVETGALPMTRSFGVNINLSF